MAKKKNLTKPNQPRNPKPLGLSYFCELRLHAECQLPRLCLSSISMVEEKFRCSGGLYAVQEGYIDVQGGYMLFRGVIC